MLHSLIIGHVKKFRFYSDLSGIALETFKLEVDMI